VVHTVSAYPLYLAASPVLSTLDLVPVKEIVDGVHTVDMTLIINQHYLKM
jgi:hypothetical protein